MYLRKLDAPRAVTLPDGSVMTQADLPPATTQRWVASRKLAVVRGVMHGLIPRAEALKRYGLSEEEFAEWVRGAHGAGAAGLRATAPRPGRLSTQD